jgi:hypothetical protein
MFNFFKKDSKPTPVIPSAAEPNKLCPYCKQVFEKNPTKKTKCTSCKNEVIVRKHYLTNQYEPFTTESVKKYDDQKYYYFRAKGLIRGLKSSTLYDEKRVDKLVDQAQIELDSRFGQRALLGDVAWSVANKMLAEAISKGDDGLLQTIYFQMGIFLHETGKDPRELMSINSALQLKRYQNSDVVKSVQVLATDDSCAACKALHNKTFSIKEAHEKKILPCRDCTYGVDGEKIKYGWCRCCYTPVIKI